MAQTPPAVGIVGRKNSGKTHLVVRLVEEFGRRGRIVSTIKHTHHHRFEIDAQGKDSQRHAQAGAREVIIASDNRWALLAQPTPEPVELAQLLTRLSRCDLVLVEGYKREALLPRIEVWRPAEPGAPEPGLLALSDGGVVAVAAPLDAQLPTLPNRCRRLDLDDTQAIAEFILTLPSDVFWASADALPAGAVHPLH